MSFFVTVICKGENVEKHWYGIVIGLSPGLSNIKQLQDRNPATNSADYSNVWNLRSRRYTPLMTFSSEDSHM